MQKLKQSESLHVKMAIGLEELLRKLKLRIMSTFIVTTENGKKVMNPVLTADEYRNLRDGGHQKGNVFSIRKGNEGMKYSLIQMNYSCLPNEDGTLKGATRMSNTVGMDIDHISAEEMQVVKERILQKKDELGLLMLELSARAAGYHLVFRRKPELSQEENLRWASELLGVQFDEQAKDITRVFFTTTASPEDLIYLDEALFETEECELKTQPSSQPTSNESAPQPTSNEPKSRPTFKGIPYSSIVAEWWRRNGGEPAEGERNVKLHKLAVNLRAICDNKKEVLMQVMPRFGLTEVELKSIIDSACKEEPKGISKMMQQIIDALEMGIPSDEVEDAEATAAETGVKVNVRTLPIGLKESLVGVPVSMHLPVLAGIMPIAGAYADGVEVKYCDGNTQHLGLMTIIRGEQASNKSVVKNAIEIWKRQLDEEDEIARKREEEWKERKKNRKASEKAPDDPHVLIRQVPITISCSTLLKRFKNAAGHCLYSFGEELDTLRKTNGAGSWSAKYDIYRLGFDRGEWGQDYNSDQAESGVVNVAYNWTVLGTNGALRNCFRTDNIENGLSSRVLIAEMPDASFAKMPKFVKRSDEDEERIQQAVTRLRTATGLIDVPRLRRAIEGWCEEKRVEAAKDIDHVKDTYRKRAAVIGFRCGVIFHLLSGAAKESKSCLDFALMMAEYCMQQQIKVFGEALENQFAKNRDEGLRCSSNNSVFDQLPPTFTMDDLRALKRNFCSEAGLRKIISRWYRDQWIEKIDKLHWRKL